MFKTVLFDLDGTLLNTIDDLADSANRVCKAHGWPEHDTAQYKYFVGNGIPKLVERFSPEDQRDPETLQKTLAEFDTVYGAHMHDKTAPYPGMPELLAKLQKNGVKMAVFSNKADEFARAVVARYFDSSLFEIVRGALPDVPTKPGQLEKVHGYKSYRYLRPDAKTGRDGRERGSALRRRQQRGCGNGS